MSDINDVLRDGSRPGQMTLRRRAADEIERLQREVEEWRACARYDPTMEGPRFTGWDRSQMDRCRKQFIEGQPRLCWRR